MPASKSIYKRGLWAERQAIGFYKDKGYSLSWQRRRVLGVEVDLLFENTEEFLMVEVKTISSLTSSSALPINLFFSQGQRQRLSRAFVVLTENLPKPVVIEAIVVDHSGEVLCLPDFLTSVGGLR